MLREFSNSLEMAMGLEKYKEREKKLSLFGKDLTRRSRSCCELCETKGVKLFIYELEPVPVDPEYERCTFLCGDCVEPLQNPRKFGNERWRFLSRSIWSDRLVVQVLAARILTKLGKTESWAREILEEVYFDEESEALIEESSF